MWANPEETTDLLSFLCSWCDTVFAKSFKIKLIIYKPVLLESKATKIKNCFLFFFYFASYDISLCR